MNTNVSMLSPLLRIVIAIAAALNLLTAGAPPIFWIYLVNNTVFLLPAAYFFWRYEQAR